MAYSPIDKASLFMTPLLWTGNDTAQTITGVPFAPAFVWIKNRDAAEKHVLVDAVRGANNFISSNDTGANNTNTEFVQSLTSDGYTLGNADQVNNGSDDFVGWNWKAGTTSGLSGGTITPSAYSFNATSKCGIYKRTGTASAGTITHGLGGVPQMIISKNLTDTSNWRVYHVALGSGNGINLNETAGDYSDANLWNGTDPTSTVYSIGSSNDTNKSRSDFVDYVFCEVPGFSSIGKYKGTGNTKGPMIYTGFKPSFILLKRWNSTSDWMVVDNKRAGYNDANYRFKANTDVAEDTGTVYVNLLSNGFKIITTSSDWNTDGSYYFYIAFGQSLIGSNGVVGTAR